MKDTVTEPDGNPEQVENKNSYINTAFVILPTQLLADVAEKRISVSAYTLYGFLLVWEGTNTHLWYGVKRMSERTGFSKAKVKRLLKELVLAGHIKRRKRMGGNSHTECLTSVDKFGRVFVCGKPVDQRARRNGAENEDSQEVRCQEKRAKRMKPTDVTVARLQKEAPQVSGWYINAYSEWLRQIPWSESRQNLYESHLSNCDYNREKAKRLFIEDIMCESSALTAFAKKEYPDLADSIQRKKPKDTVSGGDLFGETHSSVDEDEEVLNLRKLFSEPPSAGDLDEPVPLFGDDEPEAPPPMAHEPEAPLTEEELAEQKAFADSLF